MHAAKSWITVMLVVQFVGYVFDALWHGVLRPGMEPQTFGEMARHLATVHVPLYIGALGVLVATGVALLRRVERAQALGALPVAFVGAVISAAAEAWHAFSHLRMDTHAGPIAGSLSFVGFLVVVVAASGERLRRPAARGVSGSG
jgi:hypothetical protein